ncbi:MAG: hypothetical protein NVSMB52_01730 [Chloroflexota bacterium]
MTIFLSWSKLRSHMGKEFVRTGSEDQQHIEKAETARPFLEELHVRMAQYNTTDWMAVVHAETAKRKVALQAGRSQEDFTAVVAVSREQGKTWHMQRRSLGLTLEQVAEAAHLSPWDLFFIESGLPEPSHTARHVADALNGVLCLDRNE